MQDFVDGKISFETQLSDLETAMANVSSASDVTICEGTGHCAVGSIVGLNNAKVASLLGADMVRLVKMDIPNYLCFLGYLMLDISTPKALDCQWWSGQCL